MGQRFLEPFRYRWSKTGDNTAEVYAIDKVSIVMPSTGIDFSPGFYYHNQYAFFWASGSSFSMKVGDKQITIGADEFLPINPQQKYGPAEATKDCQVAIIFINKKFLNTLSASIYGTKNIILPSKSIKIDNYLKKIISSFISEARCRLKGYQIILESLASQLAIELLRHTQGDTCQEVCECSPAVKQNMNSVIKLLTDCPTRDYSLKELAEMANFSPYHFIRVFKSETGTTPYDYLLNSKIEKAKKILEEEEKSITEVCFLCGFSNPSHFSTAFKKKVGISPYKYRRQCRNLGKNQAIG